MSDDIHIQVTNHLDRGLSYAESCFETFRVIDGAIFVWDKHWQRLQQGLLSFGIQLHDKHQRHIQQSCLKAAAKVAKDSLLRLTVSGGEASWGLQQPATPHIYIQAQPFIAPTRKIHLQSVEFPFALNPKIAKFTSDYALTLRALQSWQLDAASSALICKDGKMISGTTANISLFVQNQWLTPCGNGVLKGTTCQFFIERDMVSSTSCPISFIKQAKAAVLFNAGAWVQGVDSIDGAPMNPNHPAIQGLKQTLHKQMLHKQKGMCDA